MKKLYFIIFLLFGALFCKAQISCNSFCVKNVWIDTSVNPNILTYTITFNGSGSDFINYPHIALVSNSNGDTLGIGNMNLFGQFGGTADNYSVTTDLDSIPTDFMLHFSYDTIICQFNNPCNTATSTESSIGRNINIYPNPFNSQITINTTFEFNNSELLLFNSVGKCVVRKTLKGNINYENTENLPGGLYFLLIQIGDHNIYSTIISKE